MTSLPPPCQKFKDPGCLTGRVTAAWSPTPATEQVVNSARWGTARYRHQPNKIKHRAGLRGRSPTGAGESLLRGASAWRPPGGHKPGRCDARRSSGRAPALGPRAARSGAACRGPPARGRRETARAPRRLRGLVAGPWLRPRERLPERLGLRQVPDKRMRPARGPPPPPSAERAPPGRGGLRPSTGPNSRSEPRPFTLSLTARDACPGARRDRDASVSPAFPKGERPRSHLRVTPLWRRREGGYPGASSSGSWSSSLHLSGRASPGPPRAAGALTAGVVSGSRRRRLSPASSLPLRGSSRFLFHPRDRERRRRHAYYGAGRRSPDSARRVRHEPRRRRPRPARTPRPRPAPAPAARRVFPRSAGRPSSPPRRNPGRPPPFGLRPLPRPDCARVVVAAAAARLLATLGKWVTTDVPGTTHTISQSKL